MLGRSIHIHRSGTADLALSLHYRNERVGDSSLQCQHQVELVFQSSASLWACCYCQDIFFVKIRVKAGQTISFHLSSLIFPPSVLGKDAKVGETQQTRRANLGVPKAWFLRDLLHLAQRVLPDSYRQTERPFTSLQFLSDRDSSRSSYRYQRKSWITA